MKRRLEAGSSESEGLTTLSPEIAGRILTTTHCLEDFSRRIPLRVLSFSLISKQTHLLTTHPTFLLFFKHLLLHSLSIPTFPSNEENTLLSIFSNHNIQVKNVWLYVYHLMGWLEKRISKDTYAFKKSVVRACPYFVRSPKPTDLMILSLFYPQSPKKLHPYLSHILQTKILNLNSKFNNKILGLLKKQPQEKERSILESVGNIYIDKEEMTSYDDDGLVMACFTFRLEEKEFFCVVRYGYRRDDSVLKCAIVDVKEKKRIQMKELEPLMYSIAAVVTEEQINYDPGLEEQEQFDSSSGSGSGSPGRSPSQSPSRSPRSSPSQSLSRSPSESPRASPQASHSSSESEE